LIFISKSEWLKYKKVSGGFEKSLCVNRKITGKNADEQGTNIDEK
jgi:hypothetical protein